MGAFAAVAENHSVIPKNIASDSHASWTPGDAALNGEAVGTTEESITPPREYQSSTPLTADHDDGIVVWEVEPRERQDVVMSSNRVPSELRERLGDEGALGLLALFESERADWSERVLSIAADRFERRLSEEISGVRVELSAVRADIVRELHAGLGSVRQELATARVEVRQELATARVEMRQELATSRVEMLQELATARVETLRWSFMFWIGQVAAMAGLLALMVRLVARNP
jgi:hypothetical protein